MAEESWGRVADDGSVFVRTADGERQVGQWPDADHAEALAFYTRRYDALAFEVDLLEKRIKAKTVSADDAGAAIKKLDGDLRDAQAVGDLDSLRTRLTALQPLLAEQRAARKAERAEKIAQATTSKTRIADEAEKIAEGTDWRAGADRMRSLLEEWRTLPRLDRATDDALWHRYSTARTAFTRKRKHHFSELATKRDEAATAKEKLVKQAEELSGSTDWGPTAGKYRDLMRQWKDAGSAPKGVDNALWKRFRAAQDTFFGARDTVNAEIDAEYAVNQQHKETLLTEMESAILPVTDPRAGREKLRDYLDRYDALGKVPRAAMRPLDDRLRAIEDAVKKAEQKTWDSTNPEGRARAQATVDQLQASIADLESKAEKAAARGDAKSERDNRDAAEARRTWLTQAEQALADFS